MVEIRIRIRASVLRWILLLPQASIILAGLTLASSTFAVVEFILL